MRALPLLSLLWLAPAGAATLQVSADGPFRSIQSAVDRAQPGDTILIHAGTYRETVNVAGDGVTITAAPNEQVTITGADPLPPSGWTRQAGAPVWQFTPWTYRGPTHPNDEFHRLIGRTEQVIVDGKLLQQVLEPAGMRPGTFCADTQAKTLSIWLPDGGDPANHRVEAGVRRVLMQITGSHDTIRNLRFLYAVNPAQAGAVMIEGSDNLLEDCTAEWTNGAGVALRGRRNVARNVVSRCNGQMGMSGQGVDNLMDHCTLEGNNVKGFNKGWEAGGIKIALSRNFRIVRSIAVRNDGPGFWFDIDNRNELVELSYAAENNGPGIFVEISETATIRNNLCVRNGLKDERGAWQHAGILLGEAMRAVVEHNVSLGNRIGIEVRQQRVRSLDADPSRDRPESKRYFSDQHTFRDNIAAFNREWQFALFGDNAFFGGKQPASESDLQLLDPDRRGWHSGNNLYYAADGEGLILWGAKWQPKHQEFRDLKAFEAEHHLEQDSITADPLFVNWEKGDLTLRPDSPAKRIGAGFTRNPVITAIESSPAGRCCGLQ